MVLHGRLIALSHRARSFVLALVDTQFLSILPHQKNKMLHAACGADLENKSSCSGRFQSVSSPPVNGQSPSSFVVESSLPPAQSPPRKMILRRSVPRCGACLRVRALLLRRCCLKRRAHRRFSCLAHHVRPNFNATLKPRGHAQQQEGITS